MSAMAIDAKFKVDFDLKIFMVSALTKNEKEKDKQKKMFQSNTKIVINCLK